MPLLGILLAASLWVAVPPSAAAQGVSADLQTRIVLAALAFDGSLPERFPDRVLVTVVGSDAAADALLAALDGFAGKRLRGRPLVVGQVLEADHLAGGPQIVFFTGSQGLASAELAARCAGERWICVAGDSEDVSRGLPLGVGLAEDGRPQLLLHLGNVRRAGMDLPPQVIQAARVVRR